MADPTDKSYKGLIDWSKTNPGSGSNPGTLINSDMVDGKHYSELKSEWETYADNNGGGGGVVSTGTSTFAGDGNTRSISIGVTMPNTNYVVTITPEEDTQSYVGEFYITNKTTTTFGVVNDGSGQTAFRWAVSVKDTSGVPASIALNDLSDVNTSGMSDGDSLIYEASSGLWKPSIGGSSTIIGSMLPTFFEDMNNKGLTKNFYIPNSTPGVDLYLTVDINEPYITTGFITYIQSHTEHVDGHSLRWQQHSLTKRVGPLTAPGGTSPYLNAGYYMVNYAGVGLMGTYASFEGINIGATAVTTAAEATASGYFQNCFSNMNISVGSPANSSTSPYYKFTFTYGAAHSSPWSYGFPALTRFIVINGKTGEVIPPSRLTTTQPT